MDLFADAVLAIIDMCRRPSPAPGAANHDSPALTATIKKVPKVGQSRCGACGEVGHNSAYLNLLKFNILTFLLQSQTPVARNIPRRARRIFHHRLPHLLLYLCPWQSGCHLIHLHQARFIFVHPILLLQMQHPLFSLLFTLRLQRQQFPLVLQY